MSATRGMARHPTWRMLRAVLVTLVLALACPAAADAARRQVPQDWLGVVVDGPMIEPGFRAAGTEWRRLAGSGAESVRVAIYWTQVQPDGPETIDWAVADAPILAAARRGLSVLPVLQGTPAWAAENPADTTSPPRDNADFARFVTAAVARYGPNGSLWREHPKVTRRPIRAWQIGNEPNLTLYWSGVPWAGTYVALLRAANAALKAADPKAKTVLAGLPNQSWLALEELYAAGVRGAFDIAAVHPYTPRPANVIRVLKYNRRVLAANGAARMPLWVTEFSWTAAAGREVKYAAADTTDRGQAKRLTEVMPLFVRERRKLRIERVYWYTWLSVEGSTGSAFDYSGLRRVRGGQTLSAPALTVFRRLARTLHGCAKRPGDARRCA